MKRYKIAEKKSPDDAPLIQLVRGIINYGLRRGSHRILLRHSCHSFEMLEQLKPTSDLKKVKELPNRLSPSITARLKIVANASIAEHRFLQSGNIRHEFQETRKRKKTEVLVAFNCGPSIIKVGLEDCMLTFPE